MPQEPVISSWNSPATEENGEVANALTFLDYSVLGQVTIEVAEGKVVYIVVDDGAEIMYFGELQSGEKTTYEVEQVRSNFARAASKWDAQNAVKFPLLGGLICDSWENMVLQVFQQMQ